MNTGSLAPTLPLATAKKTQATVIAVNWTIMAIDHVYHVAVGGEPAAEKSLSNLPIFRIFMNHGTARMHDATKMVDLACMHSSRKIH